MIELRKKLGLTQEEFARLVGVSLRTVANWEAGKQVSRLAQQRLDQLERKVK